MVSAGTRELKNRLCPHLCMLRGGEQVPVTDRREAAAGLRQLSSLPEAAAYPEPVHRARSGKVRPRAPNRADPYPLMPRFLPSGTARRLLDQERGER